MFGMMKYDGPKFYSVAPLHMSVTYNARSETLTYFKRFASRFWDLFNSHFFFDWIDVKRDDSCWLKVLLCTIFTHSCDLQVKVTDIDSLNTFIFKGLYLVW